MAVTTCRQALALQTETVTVGACYTQTFQPFEAKLGQKQEGGGGGVWEADGEECQGFT